MEKGTFDIELAKSCAHAFHVSTGLGCTISDTLGSILYEEGLSFSKCPLCRFANCSQKECTATHTYGMAEAERFGGKYIYLCPLGLSCFVSPIIGEEGATAKITVGPFIMVEKEDFIACELCDKLELPDDTLKEATESLKEIPFVTPEKVAQLSILLFMSTGFMNNIVAESLLIQTDRSYSIQNQIYDYISLLKKNSSDAVYPIEKEELLLNAILNSDKQHSYQYLNELLGSIFLIEGADFKKIKYRTYELMVLISRAAIKCGANAESSLDSCQKYLEASDKISSFHELCAWVTQALTEFINSIFDFSESKHSNIINKCIQNINKYYTDKLTLEDYARMVFISPAYLSRIFKLETGISFNHYINNIRIKKAKELLLNSQLKLTDISLMVGYEDQSYFTRVFKKIVGLSPNQYRNQALSQVTQQVPLIASDKYVPKNEKNK